MYGDISVHCAFPDRNYIWQLLAIISVGLQQSEYRIARTVYYKIEYVGLYRDKQKISEFFAFL